MREAIKGLFKSPVTSKHPFVKSTAPQGYRGKIIFKPELCVGCSMCIRVCCSDAIVKTTKNIEDTQEITFTFDMSSCTFCKMCADFCARKAIEFSQEYSMIGTTDSKEHLIVSGTFTKKLPPKPAAKPSLGVNSAAGVKNSVNKENNKPEAV
jgi:formate hydrogenlyase subunit 6/NADH:ubiquinone oxidoreductase subunit I